MATNLEGMMARGVDLGAIMARAKNKHRWTIQAVFDQDETAIAKLAERRLQMVNLFAKGEFEEAQALPNVGLDMNEGNLFHMDGPGCVKCGAHWEDLENGHGHGCPISDDQFEASFAQDGEQRNNYLGSIFQRLLADAGGAPATE